MNITTDKSQQVFNWLKERGLSDEVITNAKLEWNGQEIVIPIFDKEGNFLFNKYRRDPFTTDDSIPKYRYEYGSTATLFNAHTVNNKKGELIFMVEGELDCLLLNSLGLNAVSSTGGSGTFRPEWLLDFCNNEIYIVYDKDDAGVKGALRLNEMCPHAKIIFLPQEMKGKDITDYFKTHTMKQFQELAYDSSSWVLPREPDIFPRKKGEVESIIKKYSQYSEEVLEKKHDLDFNLKPTRHIEMILDVIAERVQKWESFKDNLKNPIAHKTNDDVANAKQVPITNFLEFNRAGFAKCLWHNERTASMKYRPERNKVFCHGCSAHKDVIDVVMEQRGVDFKEAVKFILNKN